MVSRNPCQSNEAHHFHVVFGIVNRKGKITRALRKQKTRGHGVWLCGAVPAFDLAGETEDGDAAEPQLPGAREA